MKSTFSLFIAFICFFTAMEAAGSRPQRPGRHHWSALTVSAAINGTEDIASVLCPDDLLAFAQTLIGIPYRAACSSPQKGFDCSGFVSYVFKNFNIPVPRSSCEFASAGERVGLVDARPGDVILFTGTHTRSRRIGHVGIIMSNGHGETTFIHATSGKAHGVTISAMDDHYHHRFVQVVRLLKQNDQGSISAE